jgi:molybdopterin molybdotransferase
MEMFTVATKESVKTLLEEEFEFYQNDIEEVNLFESRGRILAEDIYSDENIPNFIRSTVDGYAVIMEDIVGCSDSMPAFLTLIGEAKMGEKNIKSLKNGETMYVPTGGMLPENADAMVMIEFSEKMEDEVAIYRPASIRENIVGIGDDVKFGEKVLESGIEILPNHIGALAAIGKAKVQVRKKLNVAILSTGDEVISIDDKPNIGEVRDVNSFEIGAMLQQLGCNISVLKHIKDDFDCLKCGFEEALSKADVVIISGGSSVGNHDQTPDIINEIGNPGVLVHGIAIKPGKPTIIAKIGDKAVFGLPGHPASCLISYKVIVEPFLKNVLMKAENKVKTCIAESNFQVHVSSGRDVFYMVQLETANGKLIANPVHGKSGMVSLFSKADGYIEIPMSKEGLEKGERVEVNLF